MSGTASSFAIAVAQRRLSRRYGQRLKAAFIARRGTVSTAFQAPLEATEVMRAQARLEDEGTADDRQLLEEVPIV